jgi:hypothetical protein
MVNVQGQRFYNFGVTVTVPDQGKWVSVVEKDMPPLSSMPGNANFTPIRLIVNLAVVDYNNLNSVITSFDPPIELEVHYTDQDVSQAVLDGGELKLAYWDGSTWVVFTKAVNQYNLVPQPTGGVAQLQISSWAGDPPMAWGR